MSIRILTLTLGLASITYPAFGAPATSLRVDAKGTLLIPTAMLKQLGVKPDKSGSIWVEFPAPPATPVPATGKAHSTAPHEHGVEKFPPRLLLAVDKDRLLVPRTRIDRNVWIPGKPGTAFSASGAGNVLKLKRL